MKFVIQVYRKTMDTCDIPITAKNRSEAFTKANEFLLKHGDRLPWADPVVSDTGIYEVVEIPEDYED